MGPKTLLVLLTFIFAYSIYPASEKHLKGQDHMQQHKVRNLLQAEDDSVVVSEDVAVAEELDPVAASG